MIKPPSPSKSKGMQIKGLPLVLFILFIGFGIALGTSLANMQTLSRDTGENEITPTDVNSGTITDTDDQNSLKSQSLVDVTDHGAVGDGSTDDYQEIMDALDYAVNNNKDGIYFPDGTYGIGNKIWMNAEYNGMSIISDAATIKVIDEGATRVIEIKGDSAGDVEDITIKGLKLDGNTDNLNFDRWEGRGIHIWCDTSTVRNIHIEDMEIYGFSGTGLSLSSTDSVVKNVVSHHNWGHGFQTGNDAKNLLFEDITSYHNYPPYNLDYGAGFDIHGGQNVTINKFMIRNNGFGMKTSTGSPTATIKNGVIKDSNWAGYRTTGEPTKVDFYNVTVSGNDASGMEFRFGGEITLEDVSVVNNGLEENQNGAIYIADEMDKFEIVDLTIEDFPGVGINTYSSGITVDHLDISRCSGVPLRVMSGGILFEPIDKDNSQYWITSSIDVDSIESDSGGVALNRENIRAKAESGDVDIDIDTWTSTDRIFTATASSTVTFEMDNLNPYTSYSLYSSGGVTHYASTDSNGYLHFQYDSLSSEDFNIQSGGVNVETQNPTDVTKSSAVLHGEVTDMNGLSNLDVFFRYRKVGSTTWQETTHQSVSSTTVFDETVTGLSSSTEYEFKAVGQWSDGEVVSFPITFTTNFETDSYDWHGFVNPSEGDVINTATLPADITATVDSVPDSDDNGTTLNYWGEFYVDGSFDGEKTLNPEPDTTDYVFNDLTEGTHNLVVEWHYDMGMIEKDEINITIQQSQPSVATNSATSVGTNSAQLNGEVTSLGAESSVTAYFRYRKSGSSAWTETSQSTISGEQVFSSSISGLSSGTGYEFKAVIEWDSNEDTGTTKSFTTSSGSTNSAPDSPTNPSPSSGATGVSTSPTLGVDVSDPDGDSLDVTFYDSSDDSVIGTDSSVSSGSTASISWSGLSSGTTYSWYTRADDGSLSTQSSTWSFTTQSSPSNYAPDSPTNPSPSNGVTGVSVDPTLSVDVSDPDFDTMDVMFYDASDNSIIGTDSSVSSGETASIKWSGLSASTEYYWYAVADDGNLDTQSSTWSFTTTANPNSAPDEPLYPSPADGSTGVQTDITLSADVSDPEGNSMDVTFFNAADDTIIGTDTNVASDSTASVSWSGLNPETTYSWYAVANDSEYETQSATWTFTTLEINEVPAEPTNPSPADGATGVSVDRTLSVDVSDPDGDSLDVTFYDASDDSVIGTDTNVASGSTASVTWSGLSSLTTYDWYAVANDTEFENQSATWSFTTLDVNDAPDEPTNPSPADGATDMNTTVTLSVDVSDLDGDPIDVTFFNAADDTIIGTDTDVANGSTASVTWSGLSTDTTYNWYTVANDTVLETRSATWSFTTKKDTPDIITVKFMNITENSAELVGEVTDMGDYSEVTVFFRLKEVGQENWTDGEKHVITSEGEFTDHWSNLAPSTIYEFKAVLEYGDTVMTGSIKSFGTDILVEPEPPVDITPNSVTLCGELISLGDNSEVKVYFEYREKEEAAWTKTEPRTMNDTCEFLEEIDGLKPNTDYEYRAVAEGDARVEGKIKNFTTQSGAPIIINLSPAEGEVVKGEELEISAEIEHPLNYDVKSVTVTLVDELPPLEAELTEDVASVKVPFVLCNGEHTYEIYVEDVNGNHNSTRVSFYVNNERPDLSLEIENDVENEDFKIIGETDPDVRVYVDGVEIDVSEDGSFEYETTLKEGENLFEIVAEDEAGNCVERMLTGLYLPQLSELRDDIEDLENKIEHNERVIGHIENTTRKLDGELKDVKENISADLEELEYALKENTTALELAIKENRSYQKINVIQENITDIEGELNDLSDNVEYIYSEVEKQKEKEDSNDLLYGGMSMYVILGLIVLLLVLSLLFRSKTVESVDEWFDKKFRRKR